MGGFNAVVGMVKGMIKDLGVTQPVAIHLDHGMSVDAAKAAIDAGFTSVMFDGSHSTIDVNVADTKTVVELYNLEEDPSETNDIASSNEDVVSELLKSMDEEHIGSSDFPFNGIK